MNRLKTGLGALAFAATVALAGQASAATITSTFDTGADGWKFGSYLGFSGISVTHNAADGLISHAHGFGDFGFLAPLEYLGEKSEFIGGSLSFDLSSSRVTYEHRPLVALVGGNGQTIFSRWSGAPGQGLTNFTVGLTAANFYTGGSETMSGAVSESKFQAIMSDLETVQIWGDWSNNFENVKLDNVLLDSTAAVPEPATWAMMILGFGAAGTMMRRRRAALAAV